jgi:probable HAF family extracellular repeat protein
VNASGVFVGEKEVAGNLRGFATFPGSGILDLPTLGGNLMSPAAINDSNQIVGSSTFPGDDNFHAFLLKVGDAAPVDLGAFGPSQNRNSRATAINQYGHVVGWSEIDDNDDTKHAFLYKDGTMTDLNSLLRPGSGWTLTEATGINRYGQIVGTGMLAGFPHAFLLNPPLSFQVAGKKDLRVPENLKRLTFTGEGSLTLSSVTYRVGKRGKLQTAKGTLRWRFNARLKPGPNIVTIFANSPGVVSPPTKIRILRR